MGIKRSQREYLRVAIFLVMMLFSGWNHAFAGQPFFPEESIHIETRYSEPSSDSMGPQVDWYLSAGPSGNGFFIHTTINGTESFCRLTVNTAAPVINFTLSGPDSQVIDATAGAFIPFDGFPAPCRIFDINDLSGSFTMVREAGNRRFSNQFFFDVIPVSFEEAVANGWLDMNLSEDAADVELVLISVRNSAGDIIFKQLWQEGATWWLYEETQDSRSWKRE